MFFCFLFTNVPVTSKFTGYYVSIKLWCCPLTDLFREIQHVRICHWVDLQFIHPAVSPVSKNSVFSLVTPKMLLNRHSITQSNIVVCLILCATHKDINCRWQLLFCRINGWPRSVFCSEHDRPFKGYQRDSNSSHTDARILKWNALTASLHRRWSVSVAEHRVEGMSKVVGLRTVVLLSHWQQEGEDH